MRRAGPTRYERKKDPRPLSHNRGVAYTDPFGLKPCPGRLAKLGRRIERLARRIVDYKSAQRRGVADKDHLDQIEGERNGLNKDLDAYHRDGCDDDDNDFRKMRNQASSLAKAPLPEPQMRYGPARSEMVDGFCPGTNCVATPPFAIPAFGIAPGMMSVMPSFGLPALAPLPGLVPVLVP